MDSNISNKDQLYLREIDIHQYIAQGLKRKQIFKKVATKYDISERTVERQYYKVLKGISEDVSKSRSNLRTELMTRNDEIYKRSMEEGKFKVALDANMAQAKLAKLDREEEKKDNRPSIITLVEKKFDKLKVAGSDE